MSNYWEKSLGAKYKNFSYDKGFVKPEKLSGAIMDYLEAYIEDIEEDVKETTDDLTKQAIKELKQSSPKGKGSRDEPYYKGWRKQKNKRFKGKYTVKIHNKTNYQLTHLLEFGHKKVHWKTRPSKNGTYRVGSDGTRAIPHIRPLEEKYSKQYEEKITTVIRRRSKK